MTDNQNSNQEDQIISKTDNQGKIEEKKPGIWTLLVGIFLIIRGVMRLNEGELGFMGIILLVVGVGSIIYYFAKR